VGVSALLGPLANNRGPTRTHALLAGSPAIDTANPGAPGTGGLTCEVRDQRGYVRPWEGQSPPTPPALCDKGAFELCVPAYGDTGGHFSEPFAKDLICRGIASGCGSGNFCPDNPVTRGQMAVFLVASMGEQPSGVAYNAYFDDVANNVFAGFINRLYELGIAGGCGTRAYCPGTAVTREQAAVFVVVALEEKRSTAPINQYFTDLTNAATAPFVNRLYELGISGGCTATAFCPTQTLSRGTMSVWLSVAFFWY
jgi:hypothetical protein